VTSADTHDDQTRGGSAGESPPAALRVLIAEDSEDVRALTVRMLGKLGQGGEVDEAQDGQEAVDALAANRYDLLLLDLSMPRLSGLDVVRWLHAHPDRLEGLTIAVLSASAHAERPILNELGVTLVLPKPVRLQHLTELLEHVRENS
jgi:CheY-like chemotaxis protein